MNTNDLSNHSDELKISLSCVISIMLISETHYTTRSYMKITKYKLYQLLTSDGTAHEYLTRWTLLNIYFFFDAHSL